jgi:MFS family permease
MNSRIRVFRSGVIFALAYATLAYVTSSFIESLFGKSAISPAFFLGALVSLVVLATIPTLIRLFSVKYTLIGFTSIQCILVCLLGTSAIVTHSRILFYSVFALYAAGTIAILALLDIFVEHYSPRAETGRIRGIYQSLYNTGWLLGPLSSAFILGRFGFPMLFVFSAGLLGLMTLSLLRVEHVVLHGKARGFLAGIRSLRGRTSLIQILSIAWILELFYAIMVIYSPVYLREAFGFSWSTIGMMFTIMLIPFAVIEYPLGRLADKIGEKKLLMVGLCITTIATILFGSIHGSALVMGALLLATRTGAATIEIMTQTYFFKVIRENESSLVSLFRDLSPLAYLLAAGLGGVLVSVLGFPLVFTLIAAVVAVGILITSRLHDTK